MSRNVIIQCEDCNRNFKNEKGLKIHITRLHGLMGQSFLCESFSSKIDKTRRKNKIKLHLLPWIMRNNPVQKIVNLMDLNDYVVLYVLENHLRIITD
jgi:transposase-like protein